MTERLFYSAPEQTVFNARVISCRECGNGLYSVQLDRTAFFPEAGGQCRDEGTLQELPVIDISDIDGDIYHIVASPLTEGSKVEGRVDSAVRLRNMQEHGGEHLISGAAFRLYGLDNVGFHLGRETVTADFNGVLSDEMLKNVELSANEAVFSNAPIRAWFPDEVERKTLSYRSKSDHGDSLRLVQMGEFDLCACCAPHFTSCGRIGLIKIIGRESLRGGTRIYIKCGLDALEDYRQRSSAVAEVSELLSCPREGTVEAVGALLASCEALKKQLAELKTERLLCSLESAQPEDGAVFYTHSAADMRELLLVADRLSDKFGCPAAVAADTAEGCCFTAVSKKGGLEGLSEFIKSRAPARCGGRDAAVQGKASMSADELKSVFLAFCHNMLYNKSDIDIRR